VLAELGYICGRGNVWRGCWGRGRERESDDEGREGLQVDELAFVVFHFGRGGGCVDYVMYSIVGVIAAWSERGLDVRLA